MNTDFNKYLEKAKKNEDRQKEKNLKERDKIDKKIFEFKVEKLNNLLKSEGVNFSFKINRVEDHWEFDIPLEVLIGPRTRNFCAKLWKEIMGKANINMDFEDEINRVIKSMSGIVVTMKMNEKMTHEIGQGEIKEK